MIVVYCLLFVRGSLLVAGCWLFVNCCVLCVIGVVCCLLLFVVCCSLCAVC